MEFLVLTILFLVIILPLIAWIVLPNAIKHLKVTGNVINHDLLMRKFVYKAYMSREEILHTLKIKNGMDDLFCTFDLERSVILLSDDILNIGKEYCFEIQEGDGFSILRLEQIASIGQPPFLHKINPFFVSKLHAEIIPFSQYGG